MTDVTPRFKLPKSDPRLLDRSRGEVMRRSTGLCEVRWDAGCALVAQAVHHVLRRSQGGGHDPTNLLATCHHCHECVHRNPSRARARGLLAGMKRSVTDDADLAASQETQ